MRLHRFSLNTVLVLIVCGLLGVSWRYHVRNDPRRPDTDAAWRLTYDVEIESRRPGARMRVALPADTQNCRLLRQDLEQRNLCLAPPTSVADGARETVAVAEGSGKCTSKFRFDLHLNPQAMWAARARPVTLSPQQEARCLAATEAIQADDPVVLDTLAMLRQEASEGQDGLDEDPAALMLVRRIYGYCHDRIQTGYRTAPSDAVKALAQGVATHTGRNRAMIALCRAAGLPTRPVAGFRILEGGSTEPVVWNEVLIDRRWVPFDPIVGYDEKLPYDYVPVRFGAEEVVLISDADRVEVQYSLAQLPYNTLGSAMLVRPWTDAFDLARLPLDLQRVVSLILLMPLGALITCVFRNIVGLKTSGTFTPMLLALSFVFADWRTGLVILGVAVVLGLATRYWIEQLKLLMLPRLSVMVTLVVVCIVFSISVMQFFRVAPGANAVLLPMVILTMLIERFYLTTQEDGAQVALQHVAGSVIVGFFCYLILCWETVATLVLLYPETHFFTVATMVLIGRYTGYQILEPLRFRDFAGLGRG